MRRAIAAIAVFFYVSISSVRPTPYEIDIQADYLNSLLNAAKLRPMMDGEVNFSPNKDEFSNVVQSVAGKRVSEDGDLVFQMKLSPEATYGTVQRVSVVFHASNSSAIVRGQVVDISMRCENSTAVHFLRTYTVAESDEAKEWLELNINTSTIPGSFSDNCTFSAEITGNCSSLDAILVLYDYVKHSGFGILEMASEAVEKRSAGENRNRTLLSEYLALGINCSVHSVFLNFATDFRVFPDSITVISPNSLGVNMTFCFGACNPVFAAPPLNINSTDRRHFISPILQSPAGPTPRACCIPDKIEHDSLMILNVALELVTIQTFPKVATCKCVI